jgi:hypothetical protein
VAAPDLFTRKEQDFLKTLLDEGVEFMVVGLAAAALQGVPAVTQGIDLWFADRDSEELMEALRKAGVSYVPPSQENPPLLVGEAADLFDVVVHMHGLGTFADERAQARIVTIGRMELPVLPLARIIASKQATASPKDLAILPVLKDALRVVE